jgi:pyridinium-3,5-bisthiocarboxylic acid mononucleotide nickel chelatase
LPTAAEANDQALIRAVYFDCFSGASGDMILGALVDAGLDFDALKGVLSGLALPAGAFELRASRVDRAGFAATKVDVDVREPPRHRSLEDVLQVVARSSLPERDRERIAAVFRALAAAEAKVHGQPIEAVELHEVGAVDAIVDIAGAVVGLRLLGIDTVFVSPLPLGAGEVKGSHGAIPVPAPATLELIAMAGAAVAPGDTTRRELVTPTGAAILVTLGRFERPAMTVQRVGYGAGGRNPEDRPNVLRAWVGEVETPLKTMRLIETNIDDMSPELLGHVQEKLMAAGAADAWFTPIQMKKNRPAVMLSVLCRDELEDAVVGILLHETTTLGVRVRDVRRHEAEREVFEFESSLGPAAVKVKRLPGEPPRIAPEYEACRRIAQQLGMPLLEVYRVVAAEAEQCLT